MDNLVENIREELRNYIKNNGIKSLVLGISGGADSTLTVLLAAPVCKELGIPLIGRSITIDTNKTNEIERASRVGKYCDDFKELDLTRSFFTLLPEVNNDVIKGSEEGKIRHGNIKARLRMIYLYNLAHVNKGMVLSTDNYTEFLLGFSTIMGDWGDFNMIQNLWKTEIYDILQWFYKKVQDEIINDVIKSDATDGLGITNTDLDQLIPEWKGNSKNGYKKVDMILKQYLDSGIIGNKSVIDRYNNTYFKRHWPINISRSKIIF